MHIPDGILPLSHAIVYLSISAIMIIIAIWQSRRSLTLKQIPIVGVLGAGLFAAQMFNFPVPFGSSGHLIGTALATSLAGPWVAILVLVSILIIQSFFGDGGFLALGANTLNMAIVGAFTTFVIFLIVPKKWRQKPIFFSVFAGVAGFISTLMMALFASSELSLAGIGNVGLIFGWMLGLHAIIGLIEGVITFALVYFTLRADPSLFNAAEDSLFMRGAKKEETITTEPTYSFPVWATVITVGVFGGMSLFGIIASENPDGLERTFEAISDAGFSIDTRDTGLFPLLYERFPNLPTDKLWWTVIELAVIMVALFLVVILVDYFAFLIKRQRFRKQYPEEIDIEAVDENFKEESKEEDPFRLTNVIDQLK